MKNGTNYNCSCDAGFKLESDLRNCAGSVLKYHAVDITSIKGVVTKFSQIQTVAIG